MPFRFPLATVLLVRESEKKREERALQKIHVEMVRVVHQIEETNAEIAKSNDTREQAMQRPIPASHVNMLVWTTQVTVEKKRTLLRDLQLLEQQRIQQVKVYQIAHSNEEMLIDMRSRHRDTYEQELAKTQQKQLDDIFISRRHRR